MRPPPLRSSEEEEEGEGSIFALSRTRRPAGSHPGPAAAPAPSAPPGLHPSPQRYALSRVSSGGGARKAPIVININLTKQRSCLPTEAQEEPDEEARGPSTKVEEVRVLPDLQNDGFLIQLKINAVLLRSRPKSREIRKNRHLSHFP